MIEKREIPDDILKVGFEHRWRCPICDGAGEWHHGSALDAPDAGLRAHYTRMHPDRLEELA